MLGRCGLFGPHGGHGRSFGPYFGYGMYGGELTATAKCSAPGYGSNTIRKTVAVKGTQPADATIVAQIGTVNRPSTAPTCAVSPATRAA